MALTPCLPEFAEIVARVSPGSYASVYALYNVYYSIGMILGPVVGGAVVETMGFEIQMYVFACLCLTYSPIVLFAHYKRLA